VDTLPVALSRGKVLPLSAAAQQPQHTIHEGQIILGRNADPTGTPRNPLPAAIEQRLTRNSSRTSPQPHFIARLTLYLLAHSSRTTTPDQISPDCRFALVLSSATNPNFTCHDLFFLQSGEYPIQHAVAGPAVGCSWCARCRSVRAIPATCNHARQRMRMALSTCRLEMLTLPRCTGK